LYRWRFFASALPNSAIAFALAIPQILRAMKWYYSENNQQMGPVEDAALGELVNSGRITPETLVWRDGMPDWLPYKNVSGEGISAASGIAEPTGIQTVRCTECGNYFAADEIISIGGGTVCAACKPMAVQKLKEGVRIVGVYHYAGFWIRVAAKIVDILILLVVRLVLNLILIPGMQPMGFGRRPTGAIAITFLIAGIGLCINCAYNIWFIGRFGATPGKMACGLRVIRADGEPLGYGRATGRYFAEWLCGLTLYIGYIMAAFDDEKRALHDRVCDTRVIYK